MKEADASIIYGGFLALCYLTPLLGGFIADRFLGNRMCIIVGGLMMALGQLLLFFSASIFSTSMDSAQMLMWVALGIIIFGNGFFKPNISSMVGSLYPKQDKSRLDSAFTIFYMGINLGAFLGQFICPFIGDVKDAGGIRDIHAFKWGFLAASIAMIIGTAIFIFLKNKYVVTPEGRPLGGSPKNNNAADYEEGEATQANFTGKAIGFVTLLFVALFFVFRYLLVGEFSFSGFEIGNSIKGIIYPVIYAAGISLAVLIVSDASLTKIERQRIYVIYIISFFIIFFWAAFEQAGSSLTFIADNQTDRNFFGWNMPPSMVQIFNGLFVVILAIPFSILWDKLRAKGKEPLSPFKQAIGLLVIAISYVIIAYNVKDLGNSGLLAIKWLILLYFIQTCAELCLSPIGLSLVGKLAPKRFASLAYGVFFISNAAGYALAGTLGSILPATGDKYIAAEKANIDLKAVLDGTTVPDGTTLFTLAKMNLAKVDVEKAKENNLPVDKVIKNIGQLKAEREEAVKKNTPFVNKYTAQDTAFTAEQLATIKDKQIITASHPSFIGYKITNLFEFFMVFVVLCGIAAVILAAITPLLKKMMHGVK